MSAQHTPGPWSVGSSTVTINGAGHSALAIWPPKAKAGKRGKQICLVAPIYDWNETDEANARLIAAAPELLEALRHLREHGVSPRAWDMLNAAIAKAEGRS